MKNRLTTLTIIEGPRDSGKSLLSELMTKNQTAVHIRDFKSSFGFSQVYPDTEVLIFDESLPLEEIFEFFKQPTITVNRKYDVPVTVNMPNVIVIIKSE